MGLVLNYQEVYLGQVQLLNVVPLKEMAATFANLKVSVGMTFGWVVGGDCLELGGILLLFLQTLIVHHLHD